MNGNEGARRSRNGVHESVPGLDRVTIGLRYFGAADQSIVAAVGPYQVDIHPEIGRRQVDAERSRKRLLARALDFKTQPAIADIDDMSRRLFYLRRKRGGDLFSRPPPRRSRRPLFSSLAELPFDQAFYFRRPDRLDQVIRSELARVRLENGVSEASNDDAGNRTPEGRHEL